MTTQTSICRHCARPIVFEPYFLDGKPGPNPPVWFHLPGFFLCIDSEGKLLRFKAEPVEVTG